MNHTKIVAALEKYDWNYVEKSGKIIVKLDYSQQIIIDVSNLDKIIIKDKLVGWNFLTGSIEMSIKNAMLYNFIGLLLFSFMLLAFDKSQMYNPFFLGYIGWVLLWTPFYLIKSESFKQQIVSWTTY